jgi:hypothetical protein
MNDSSRPLIIDPVEQKEFQAGTILGINAEIHPLLLSGASREELFPCANSAHHQWQPSHI